MAPTFPNISPLRLRSYIFRLPLLTRIITVVILALWVIGTQSIWDERQWGALIPSKVGLASMYRINTYPLVHSGFLHTIFVIVVLVPLLERFEAGNGTLLSLAMLAGPLSTLPAGLYILLERGIWGGDAPIMGASMWIFVFLGVEAIKTYKGNPNFTLSTYKIPTWILPIILTLFVSILLPNTSFLGHICALLVGYLYGLGYLKIFAPPEKALRWIEGKLNLLGRLPHYVSVDQKTYGRYGVLPSSAPGLSSAPDGPVSVNYMSSTQRLGP